MSDGRQQGQCEESGRGKAQNMSWVQQAPRMRDARERRKGGVCKIHGRVSIRISI